MTTPSLPALKPLLVVRNAPEAIAFYVRALGAAEITRFMNARSGTISHADLALGAAEFSVTEEARAWNSDAPPSLGGSPVVLQLRVENVDAAFERMRDAGAAVVFGLADFCGDRMARLRDPFGHLWILSERIEELSASEVQRRRDAWRPPVPASKAERE
jgi:PhnB protein